MEPFLIDWRIVFIYCFPLLGVNKKCCDAYLAYKSLFYCLLKIISQSEVTEWKATKVSLLKSRSDPSFTPPGESRMWSPLLSCRRLRRWQMGAPWKEFSWAPWPKPVHASSSQVECLCVLVLAPVQVNVVSAHRLGGLQACGVGKAVLHSGPTHLRVHTCRDTKLLRPPRCRPVPKGLSGRPQRWPDLWRRQRETPTALSFAFADPTF